MRFVARGSFAAVVLLCGACSRQPAANQSATTSAPPTGSPVSSVIDAATAPPANVDLSAYNTNIARLEDQAAKTPGDEARLALSKAYLARAKALTQARQYRAALDDYRRVLRYDPDNEEAPQLAANVTSILQSEGHEAPTEGNDPSTPLAVTPDTIAGNDAAGPSAKASSTPARKKGKQ